MLQTGDRKLGRGPGKAASGFFHQDTSSPAEDLAAVSDKWGAARSPRARRRVARPQSHFLERRAVTSISTFISGLSRPATTSMVEAGRMERRRSPQTRSTGSWKLESVT
jgi:hypothetical protein